MLAHSVGFSSRVEWLAWHGLQTAAGVLLLADLGDVALVLSGVAWVLVVCWETTTGACGLYREAGVMRPVPLAVMLAAAMFAGHGIPSPHAIACALLVWEAWAVLWDTVGSVVDHIRLGWWTW